MSVTLWSTPTTLCLPNDEASTRASLYLLFLRNSRYTFERLKNAASCSPDRILPVASYRGRIITGFESIATIVDVHRVPKNGDSSDSVSSVKVRDKFLSQIYLPWLSQSFCNIMTYFTWVYEPTVSSFTFERVGYGFPSIVSNYMFKQKKQQHLLYLSSMKWTEKSVDDVHQEFVGICFAISQILSTGPYIFGQDNPGELDALIYGYWSVLRDFIHIFSPIKDVIESNRAINDLVGRLISYKMNMEKL